MFYVRFPEWSLNFYYQDLYKNPLRRDMITALAASALFLLASALAEKKYKGLAAVLSRVPVVLTAVLVVKYFFLSRKARITLKDRSGNPAGAIYQSYWNYTPVFPKKNNLLHHSFLPMKV